MKQLKVTVTGWQNNVFIGNEKQVQDFLVNLRESQINAIPTQTHRDKHEWKDIVLDKGYYKKITVKSKTVHFNVTPDQAYAIMRNYERDDVRRKFEEQNAHLGLKIKIETIQDPNNFLF